MDTIIKNISMNEVLNLKEQISIREGEIVSKTLVQNEALSITLFGIAKNEEISTHQSTGDAFVYVLEGTGRFTVDGVAKEVKAGEALIMPHDVPHALFGQEAFKMLLTVVFPNE